ncbi:major histocompatibility complex class I-related gene protein-like isoform X2 [Hemicordylus capensis]|uniref:major histocompatibility complex class I-related gene protein-like isoform X2 n=1 Tax=Hemicordylus capensis TaxID=884348 RepID=UPI0023022A0B|nr:major histocompatibility complex class I-related gene protein-like isoform X2 [Hemicordylus capensis]
MLERRGGSAPGSSWHSLRHFYLGVSEPIEGLPWFTQVGYVDDQLITRYDSSTRRDQPQVPWVEEEEDPRFWEWETHHARDAEFFFKLALMILQSRYNQHGGLHTWQCLLGCEMCKDGKQKGRSMLCGYDGKDFISLDEGAFTWKAANEVAQLTKRKWEADLAIVEIWKAYLEEECFGSLQKYLDHGKVALLRREPPAMKVTRQVGPDGLEILTCRAHGFYPKEIDATWRKDGEIWEQETFRGDITPNSDGTYHTWLSIEIDPKEREHYRCHVEHDGLLEPLDMAWEKPGSVPMEIIVGAVLGAVAAGLLVAGIVFYIKKSQQDVSKAVRERPALAGERSLFIPSHVHTDDLPSIYEEPYHSLHRRGMYNKVAEDTPPASYCRRLDTMPLPTCHSRSWQEEAGQRIFFLPFSSLRRRSYSLMSYAPPGIAGRGRGGPRCKTKLQMKSVSL